MICIVSYFLCVFFFNKIKFLGGLELEHYWSSEKGKKKPCIYGLYIIIKYLLGISFNHVIYI